MPDFVGRGWAFPIRTGMTGGIGLVGQEREIEEAIRIVLATAPGERPMRPDFGCRIHDFVFNPADSTTAAAISTEVTNALTRWEPRIDIEDVVVSGTPDDPTRLYIDVSYSIRRTNARHNLVFPFYVIPGE
jgi:Bacteriophage baseplate protein W